MFRVASFATQALLALLAAPSANAIFHVEKANVIVRLPASIAGSYDMAIANFGSPIYGAALSCVPGAIRHPRVLFIPPDSDEDVSVGLPSLASAQPHRLFPREAQQLTIPDPSSPQGRAGVPPRQPRRVLPLRTCPRPARSRRDSHATLKRARRCVRAEPADTSRTRRRKAFSLGTENVRLGRKNPPGKAPRSFQKAFRPSLTVPPSTDHRVRAFRLRPPLPTEHLDRPP